jgi:hypothetical protein
MSIVGSAAIWLSAGQQQTGAANRIPIDADDMP